jgi:hypothetical protein
METKEWSLNLKFQTQFFKHLILRGFLICQLKPLLTKIFPIEITEY